MSIFVSELLTRHEHPDGHTYKLTLESGITGLSRLNIACLKPDSDEARNSQGVDLTAAECRALAKLLSAAAGLMADEV